VNVLLWILAGLLALAFLAAGALKVSQPVEALASKGMAWTEDFAPAMVKAIGGLEILGAIGVILPGALKIAPTLVPVAATGLAVLMAGAIITHVRRGELSAIAAPAVLLIVSAVLAWGRYGPHKIIA
jgi:hypothetical protein